MSKLIRYPHWLHELLMLLAVPLWFTFIVSVWVYLIHKFAGPVSMFP